MGQNLNKIESMYNTIAKEWLETFYGEHEKKPKDQENLHRFAQGIGERRPVRDFGCGSGNTVKYLNPENIENTGFRFKNCRNDG